MINKIILGLSFCLLAGCYKVVEEEKKYEGEIVFTAMHCIFDTTKTGGEFRPSAIEFSFINKLYFDKDSCGHLEYCQRKYIVPGDSIPTSRLSFRFDNNILMYYKWYTTSGINPVWYHHVYTISKDYIGLPTFNAANLKTEHYNVFTSYYSSAEVIFTTTDSLPNRAGEAFFALTAQNLLQRQQYLEIK